MLKNIKITERQYQMLQEADENTFPYVTNSISKPFDGNTNTTADGKVDGEENAKPTTSDEVASMRRMDGWWNGNRSRGNNCATMLREFKDEQSNDFYDVSGFKNKELNTLTDENDKNDLEKIPYSIEQKLNFLLDLIKQMNLSPRKQGMIVKKVIQELDYDAIPNQWKKQLINDLK
jgi:hypothetical protein